MFIEIVEDSRGVVFLVRSFLLHKVLSSFETPSILWLISDAIFYSSNRENKLAEDLPGK